MGGDGGDGDDTDESSVNCLKEIDTHTHHDKVKQNNCDKYLSGLYLC